MRPSLTTWTVVALVALVVAAGVTFAASRILGQPLGTVPAPRVADRLAPPREEERPGGTGPRPARPPRATTVPRTPAPAPAPRAGDDTGGSEAGDD